MHPRHRPRTDYLLTVLVILVGSSLSVSAFVLAKNHNYREARASVAENAHDRFCELEHWAVFLAGLTLTSMGFGHLLTGTRRHIGMLSDANSRLQGEVDERKRAGGRARHLASFTEMNPNPVLEVNGSGKVAFFNPAAREVLEHAGLSGEGFEVFLPVDLQGLLEEWDRKNESVIHREVAIRDLVFHETVHFIPGKGAVRIYARDATDRKRAMEALQESENKFKDLAEKSIVGIYLIQHRLFRYVNPAFASMIGYPVEELIDSKGPHDLVSPDDLPQFLEKAGPARFEGAGMIHETFRVVTKQGETRNAEVYGSYTTYKGRRAVIGTLLDVTDRENETRMRRDLLFALELKNNELETAYAELKESQKKVIQQEKMASIGQLAAGVAHEINNPMSFIISNLGSLQKYMARVPEFIAVQSKALAAACGEGGSPGLRESVEESRRSLKIDHILVDAQSLIDESLEGADRVKRIVQDLKNFARVDEGGYAPADINRILDSTLNIVWNELKHRSTVKRAYGEIPPVSCNAGQLSQVFMNILVNASQAMAEFGEIVVSTGQTDGYVRVTISDTGSGIPEEQLGRIFEPFFTTKEIGKGTGLGLSIAYDIVKKHKGEIEVKSTVGVGTTFVVAIGASKEGTAQGWMTGWAGLEEQNGHDA